MSHELEYFTEYLNDPSVPEIHDFYRLLREWAEYVREHQHEFNYLVDEEWREIRERLVAEVHKRDAHKQDIEDRFEFYTEIICSGDKYTPQAVLECLQKQLVLMTTYRKLYDFNDEDIRLMEKDVADYAEYARNAQLAQNNAIFQKAAVEKSIGDLDEALADYQKKTGKTPVLPAFNTKKNSKGN